MTSSTLMELSRKTGRDVTSLSSGDKRLQTRALRDSELAMRVVGFKGVMKDVAKLHHRLEELTCPFLSRQL